MNIQQEIEKLERELVRLKREQKECPHEWSDTKYNPYEGTKQIADGIEAQGSDIWPKMKIISTTKDRWTRTCNLCGLQQHTEKLSDVSKPKMEPDFK